MAAGIAPGGSEYSMETGNLCSDLTSLLLNYSGCEPATPSLGKLFHCLNHVTIRMPLLISKLLPGPLSIPSNHLGKLLRFLLFADALVDGHYASFMSLWFGQGIPSCDFFFERMSYCYFCTSHSSSISTNL